MYSVQYLWRMFFILCTHRLGYYINPYSAEIFFYEPWRPKVFFQFEIIVNVLVSFPLHLKTDVVGLRSLWLFLLFQCGDRLCTSESDVYRRQILTSQSPHCKGSLHLPFKILSKLILYYCIIIIVILGVISSVVNNELYLCDGSWHLGHRRHGQMTEQSSIVFLCCLHGATLKWWGFSKIIKKTK